MPNMTKKGARSVTATLDRLAELVQKEASTLGITTKHAHDFAMSCDVLSDSIEKKAGIKRALTELDVNKEKGFDPEVVGEETTGPLEGDTDEPFMKAEFTQQENRELRERVQDGDLGPKPNLEEQAPTAGKQASINTRMASACGDLLKASSSIDNAVVSNSVAKLAAAAVRVHLASQAGLIDRATAERTVTAVNHVLTVVGSTRDLARVAHVVDLAFRILSKKAGDEGKIPPQILEKIEDKKDEKKEDEKNDEKESSKKASHGFDLFA